MVRVLKPRRLFLVLGSWGGAGGSWMCRDGVNVGDFYVGDDCEVMMLCCAEDRKARVA